MGKLPCEYRQLIDKLNRLAQEYRRWASHMYEQTGDAERREYTLGYAAGIERATFELRQDFELAMKSIEENLAELKLLNSVFSGAAQ